MPMQVLFFPAFWYNNLGFGVSSLPTLPLIESISAASREMLIVQMAIDGNEDRHLKTYTSLLQLIGLYHYHLTSHLLDWKNGVCARLVTSVDLVFRKKGFANKKSCAGRILCVLTTVVL